LKYSIFDKEIAKKHENLFFLTSRPVLMPYAADKFEHIIE